MDVKKRCRVKIRPYEETNESKRRMSMGDEIYWVVIN
jgi:hypothetical protein